MVLLAGPGPEGGGARCVSPQPLSPPRGTEVDEDLGDYEEYEDFSSLPDTRSIASDDSFYPPGGEERCGPESVESVPEGVPEAATILRAACANDVGLLRALVRRGPRVEEVQETDRNGRTGLIIACYHGFVDTVVALAECPHVDVNWQDSEGNTALITAAQAGHATITSYLLNYFPGLDLERRNVFGFTALMKAAMQGRIECIRALMLAGADVHARDPRRRMSPQEWAAYTGRTEAVRLMHRLLERPCPEQFGESYRPELPQPPVGAAKLPGSRGCLQRLADFLRSSLTSRSARGLEDGGVLDHMVRMTTSLYSPAVAVVCQTVCPEDPPCVGKRRLAVQEILAAREAQGTPDLEKGAEQQPRTSQEGSPQASPPAPPLPGPRGSGPVPRRASLLQLLRRSSVRPGVVVPRVRVSKAPAPTFQPERAARKSSTKDSAHLQIPKWRYKEAKEERKRAEEAEKKRQAEAQERRAPRWKRRT
ncbi:ankyrin repeat domain-containing protein 33B isoform X1 [Ochotona princeps]|uniref:ankyrin repeat domain-containing protein 33B isoform X1 n=2 Tax=Ochotona princeps TaxID=9978 RepID=UPI00032AECF6|nr:ankyrin repeat domain-containing protein 33B isoform X1 [Ochotona princeps]